MSSLLDAALTYARKGLPVFPCAPRAKRPITKHGLKDASTDPDTIRAWWSKHPDANIGIAVPATHVVIDIDDMTTAARVSGHLGAFSKTWTASTGGGGAHYWYRLPAGRAAKNKVKMLAGVDVRTVGGYVIAPPSVHESGQPYRWVVDHEVATCPRWLVTRLDPREKKQPAPAPPVPQGSPDAYGRKALDLESERVRSAGEGCRNSTLNEAAFKLGQLVGGGELAEADVRNALTHAAHECGLGEREAARAIGNGLEAGRQNPRRRAPRAERPPREQAPTAAIAQGRVGDGSAEPEWHGDDDWREKLQKRLCSLTGTWINKSSLSNALIVLENDPAWKGRLAFNEFSQKVTVLKPLPRHDGRDTAPTPRPWNDQDDVYAAAWIELKHSIRTSPERACQIAAAVARQQPFHPVREYLDGLVWDRVPRLKGWLEVYLGVPASDYATAVGTWWLTAAVARIYRPGCKADNVLILEGPQGQRKSSALRVLASQEWFSDSPADLGSKDSFLQIQGRWIIELAELDALGRAAASRAKAHFSSAVDDFRPPFGRHTISVPRQCIFAGTVNPSGDGYFKDATGNRRYWPVQVQRVELRALELDRDQLWAEAAERFKSGGRWWPEGPEENALCSGEQAQRQQSDPWEEVIETWLAGAGRRQLLARELTANVILSECIKMPKDKMEHRHKSRVGVIMATLGYERERRQVNGVRERVFVRSEDSQ